MLQPIDRETRLAASGAPESSSTLISLGASTRLAQDDLCVPGDRGTASQRTDGGRKKLIATSVLIGLFSVVIAYAKLFTFQNISFNDDEGTLMMFIKRLLDGRVLYDDVPVIYGPFYYFYEWCAHRLFGIGVTHESIRWISLCFWIACAMMVFLLVYRATRSLLVATATHFLSLLALGFLSTEVGHPQELCLLLLIAFGLAACVIRHRVPLMLVLGALAAGMTLCKINLGVFGVMALTLALLASLKPGWLRSVLFGAASGAAIALPFLLMRGHITESWALKFGIVTSVSLGAAVVAIWPDRSGSRMALSGFLWAAIGFALAAVAICLFPIALGSTLHGIIDSLVLLPLKFGQSWFLEAHIPGIAIPWALLGIVLAVLTTLRRVGEPAIAVMKLLLGVAVGLAALSQSWDTILAFAPPFLWLILVPPVGPEGVRLGTFPRAILAFTSVIQILYAYPAAGGQVLFASVMIIAVAAICLSEALPILRTRFPQAGIFSQSPKRAMVQAAALTTLYVLLTASSILNYRAGAPLGLPGTAHMRIDPKEAAFIRTVAGKIDSSPCSMLVTAPGMFSFNFLSGRPAASGIHFASWMLALADSEQEKTIDELSRQPYPCVLYSQSKVDYWSMHADVSSSPLIRYIRNNFQTTSATFDFDLMEPRDRAQGR